jgi:NADPH:quinone reductase-like Zn-dependent oxidoreductase
MALVGGGGQAALARAPEAHVLPIPAGLDWPQAGGFPEVFFTAFDALFLQAGLALGERLLVTGAAGGVGTAAVQLGAAAGAHVVAAARAASLHDELLKLGAAAAIDPAHIADHGPYDVVLELVGATSLSTALRALATGGRAVVIGVGAGDRLDLDLHTLMRKRAQVRASTLRARSAAEKALLTAAVERNVLPLLAAGRLTIPIVATFPMSEAARAYERFVAGGKLGKIVLSA